MTNYEELYRNETGKNTRGRSNSYFEKWYHYEFVYWLIQKLSDKDKLLTAEVSRREAAEEYLMAIELNKAYSEESNFMFCTERDKWRDSITAYEAAVKTGGE